MGSNPTSPTNTSQSRAALVRPWLAVVLSVVVHSSGCSDPVSAGPGSDVVVTGDVDPGDGDVAPAACRRNVVMAVDALPDDGALAIDVPPGATSFLLTARTVGDDDVAFDSLVSPSGEERLAPGWSRAPFGATCLSCPNRTTFAAGAVNLLVPVRPGIAVEPGHWTGAVVEAGASRWGELDLDWAATAVLGEDLLTPLRLPLTVVARDSAGLEAFRDGGGEAPVTAALGAAGITVVFEWATDAALPASVDALAIGSLQRESLGISVLFVDALSGTDAVTLAGASPLPGPARDGVLVVARDAPAMGRTLAHELGHFLGLYHLTEPGSADIHDPIPDTALADDDNLMHVSGNGTGLTAQQMAVLRGHPVLVAPECN
ncbi:MAG: hypothetical protein IV100_30155 [Myxococcales bacterium]|nr:hypothetical protein [Myxococcales bacterium]